MNKIILVLILLLLVATVSADLTTDERTAYLEYFNYTGEDNETEKDSFLNRTRSEINHEPYDNELCGFEVTQSTITVQEEKQINGTLINVTKEVTMLCQLMTCTANTVTREEHRNKVRAQEREAVVRAWNNTRRDRR